MWCKEEIETSSPLISYGQEPPSAEMIKHLNFSNTLGVCLQRPKASIISPQSNNIIVNSSPSNFCCQQLHFLGAMPLNLRVQIIERRKKSGSTQHYIDDFQDFLLSCFKISLVTLILEVGGQLKGVFRLIRQI